MHLVCWSVNMHAKANLAHQFYTAVKIEEEWFHIAWLPWPWQCTVRSLLWKCKIMPKKMQHTVLPTHVKTCNVPHMNYMVTRSAATTYICALLSISRHKSVSSLIPLLTCWRYDVQCAESIWSIGSYGFLGALWVKPLEWSLAFIRNP